MKRESGGRSKPTSTSKGGGEEGTSSLSKGEPVLGSLIWIRLNGNSWWPAQVVDENGVSETNKPYGILPGGVLVRLYGSYQYLFVDPVRSVSEFETVLSQNNGSYHDIFRRALEQDVPTSKAGRSKRGGSTPKGAAKTRNGASKDATPDRRLAEGNVEAPTSLVKPEERSTRRLRMMKNLGLIGPSGSPFHKNGCSLVLD